MDTFISILQQTLMISMFVLIMMLVIEYINIQTRGNWKNYFSKHRGMQVLLAALLGLAPGCLGTYAVVSLYTHNIVNFAALVTAMIATSGDEFFVMVTMIPETSLLILAIIFPIAVVTGLLINAFVKKQPKAKLHIAAEDLVHEEPECICYDKQVLKNQLKNITFQRALLIVGGLFFLFLIWVYGTGHEHVQLLGDAHDHSGHDHAHGHGGVDWLQIVLTVAVAIGLFIVSTVPDHFIDEHLWKHIVKKHLPKIFLWTFGAMFAIHMLEEYISVADYMKEHQLIILLVAVLIGIIPESGPHIVFISLYATGGLPFSILLANSIVQDGHGALPLFAESKRSFVLMKTVNMAVGLAVGLLGLMFSF